MTEKIEYHENGKLKVKVYEPDIEYDFITNHNFNVGLAQRFGVNEAIFLNNLIFWIKKNIANSNNYHDGLYWTYNSNKALLKLFPYWSESQLRTIIKNLEKNKIIKTGNYNKVAYDRTKWYTIIDKCICEIYQMEVSILTNRIAKIDKPIPDLKPDLKPDHNAVSDDLEKLKNMYPTRCPTKHNSTNRSTYNKKKARSIIKDIGLDEAIEIINLYINDCKNTKTYIKNYAVFINNFPSKDDFIIDEVIPERNDIQDYINNYGSDVSD